MRNRVIFVFLLGLLPTSLTWAAPAQQTFSDWQVTCNNQNFCVARNTGEHRGLVMTLSRSAGAHTDAVLRIDLGGLTSPNLRYFRNISTFKKSYHMETLWLFFRHVFSIKA